MNAPLFLNPKTIPADRSRSTYLGASDVAAILGVSRWKTVVDLWLSKVEPQEDQTNLVAKRRGQRMEPYILDMIREEYGFIVYNRNHRYVDPEYDFLAAEIDFEATLPDAGVNVNGEIKTVHPFMAKEWGESESDGVPDYYVAQVQFGLGITGRQSCHVFALIGDDLRHYVIERDQELIDLLRVKAVEFWREYVLKRVQPPFDFNDWKTLSTVKRLYPGTDGRMLDADSMQTSWREVYEQATAKARQYEAIADGAKAHLLAEMGEAAVLRFGDGKEFRRKVITKKPYVVEYAASTYVDFRLATSKD